MAQDALGDVPRTAFGGVVFAGAFDGDAELVPFGGPFEFPGEFAVAVEGGDAAPVVAPLGPGDEIGLAMIVDLPSIEVGDLGGADFAAALADDLEREPMVGSPGTADVLVDGADLVGVAQDGIDGLVEVAAPVDVPHAVDAGADAEFVEDVKEFADVMIGHVGGVRAVRGGDVAERFAHVLTGAVGGVGGKAVHGVVVVDAVDIDAGDAPALEGAIDGVMDEDAAQGAHVYASGGGFGIVDDLVLPVEVVDEFVGPHGSIAPVGLVDGG